MRGHSDNLSVTEFSTSKQSCMVQLQSSIHYDSNSTPSKEQSNCPEHVVKIADNAEVLEVIKEEQVSMGSSVKIHPSNLSNKTCSIQKREKYVTNENESRPQSCFCHQNTTSQQNNSAEIIDGDKVENLFKETEWKLRAEYDIILRNEITSLKERFDYMLQNEQLRASYMLREAHRERQEKIRALESQLECKNLAALIYVMCAERSRSKIEKQQLIKEYTEYIKGLQDLLIEGQQLILSLSRGYKTAARVDNEWRTKMKKVVHEFMSFIYHFAGGPPETNQFLIDLPKLLKTETPLEDDAKVDPCDDEPVIEDGEAEQLHQEKTWWEMLEGEDRPFVMFGDMCDFTPPQRRQVLKKVKAAKTAPRVWKEYVFNDLSLKKSCENAEDIQDIYLNYRRLSLLNNYDYIDAPELPNRQSRMSVVSRRHTGVSVDMRGGDLLAMGSILKIITSTYAPNNNSHRTNLLGARDSMEITSTTKLRHLTDKDEKPTSKEYFKEVFKLDIAKRHATNFNQLVEKETEAAKMRKPFKDTQHRNKCEQDDEESFNSRLGNLHTDSMQVIQSHKPDKDHKINYERICPMEKCQRLQVDSFMRSLPPYMRANPFTHFQQTFEAYETCTPEQLEILRERLDAKKHKGPEDELPIEECPLKEWSGGIATQTSAPESTMSLPCTCAGPMPSPVDSNFVFNVHDLIPVKLAIDAVQKECLFDDRINFNRFKVVGQDSENPIEQTTNRDFKQQRSAEITKILKQHPSLLDIFQANAQ